MQLRGLLWVDDDLCYAMLIAQVNENQLAKISAFCYPPKECHLGIIVLLGEFRTMMSSLPAVCYKCEHDFRPCVSIGSCFFCSYICALFWILYKQFESILLKMAAMSRKSSPSSCLDSRWMVT